MPNLKVNLEIFMQLKISLSPVTFSWAQSNNIVPNRYLEDCLDQAGRELLKCLSFTCEAQLTHFFVHIIILKSPYF